MLRQMCCEKNCKHLPVLRFASDCSSYRGIAALIIRYEFAELASRLGNIALILSLSLALLGSREILSFAIISPIFRERY
jgi:hypothetical protein